MRKQLSLLGGCLALTLPGAAGAIEALPAGLARLSPADFASKADVIDDPVEPAVIVSTRNGYKAGQPMVGAFADDVHLRALIDRQTGATRWQVWHSLINHDRKARVTAINYALNGTARSTAPISVDHWEDVCSPGDGARPCHAHMRVVFELPEDVVADIAGSYRAGSRAPWRVKFKDAAGHDMTGGLAPAEAAGLIEAVRGWRESSGAATRAATLEPNALAPARVNG